MGLSALLGGIGDGHRRGGPPPEAPTPSADRVPAPLAAAAASPFRRSRARGAGPVLSIGDRGVLQPLLVLTLRPGRARLRDCRGERRWRAAQRAGLHEVPVVVREISDQETLELALIENLQRADLSPLDEAHAFRRLTEEFGHTQEAAGASRSARAAAMWPTRSRLLSLPVEVHETARRWAVYPPATLRALARLRRCGSSCTADRPERGLERARDRGLGPSGSFPTGVAPPVGRHGSKCRRARPSPRRQTGTGGGAQAQGTRRIDHDPLS